MPLKTFSSPKVQPLSKETRQGIWSITPKLWFLSFSSFNIFNNYNDFCWKLCMHIFRCFRDIISQWCTRWMGNPNSSFQGRWVIFSWWELVRAPRTPYIVHCDDQTYSGPWSPVNVWRRQMKLFSKHVWTKEIVCLTMCFYIRRSLSMECVLLSV